MADFVFEREDPSKRITDTTTNAPRRAGGLRSARLVLVLFLRTSSVCLDFFVLFLSRKKGQEEGEAYVVEAV
jgi:hypothetical protein